VDVVLLLAAAAILVGVVAVAMGGGGELALFRRDLPPLRFRLRSPEDVATLRLPLAPLGYQEQAAREAFRAIARLLDERDAEIARLRDEVMRLRSGAVAPGDSAPAGGISPAAAGGSPAAGAGQPSAQT
jgi:hypothetical protein